jgi:hypothetical protein
VCFEAAPHGLLAEAEGMTEQEWLACAQPTRMIRFLIGTDHPRVQDVEAFPDCKGSDRKLRLFACACYDYISHLLPCPLARSGVETVRRFADGEVDAEELQRSDDLVQASLDSMEAGWRASRGAERAAVLPTHEALALASVAAWTEAPKAAYYASSNAYLTVEAIANPRDSRDDKSFASWVAEEKAQAEMLRDIFGPLPFRPRPLDPRWRTPQVVSLAQAAYEAPVASNPRRPGWLVLDRARLLILADALEEAGAEASEVLDHLRGPGEHIRGCWCVDWILGKE